MDSSYIQVFFILFFQYRIFTTHTYTNTILSERGGNWILLNFGYK
jgi:hypothetical protein